MFHVIGLLYTIQIVAKFYKVQYVHMKRDAVSCPNAFVAIFFVMFLEKKLAKSN